MDGAQIMLSKHQETKRSVPASQVKGKVNIKKIETMLTMVTLTEGSSEEAFQSLKNQMQETAGDVSVPDSTTQVQMELTSAGSTLHVGENMEVSQVAIDAGKVEVKSSKRHKKSSRKVTSEGKAENTRKKATKRRDKKKTDKEEGTSDRKKTKKKRIRHSKSEKQKGKEPSSYVATTQQLEKGGRIKHAESSLDAELRDVIVQALGPGTTVEGNAHVEQIGQVLRQYVQKLTTHQLQVRQATIERLVAKSDINLTVDATSLSKRLVNELLNRFPDIQANKKELKYQWHLPEENKHFVDKETTPLASVKSSLVESDYMVITQVFSGYGGLGKTSLAVAYARAHQGDYDGIYLVKAENDLRGEFYRLALYFYHQGWLENKPEQEDDGLYTTVYRILAERLNNVLFIFDNVTDYTSVERYLPSENYPQCETNICHCLITSRYQVWPASFSKLDVEGYSLTEAMGYIKSSLADANYIKLYPHEVTDGLAERLAIAMEKYPLAIAQAVAQIKKMRYPIARYLERFEEYTSQYLAKDNKLPGYQGTVLSLLKSSFKFLEESCPQAIEILHMCAYLAPDNIPNFLFEDELEADWDDVVTELSDYSLITVMPDESFSMHRMVQLGLRVLLEEETREELLVNTLENCASSLNKYFSCERNKIPSVEVRNGLFEHVESFVQLSNNKDVSGLRSQRIRLYISLGVFYIYFLRKPDTAILKFELALEEIKGEVKWHSSSFEAYIGLSFCFYTKRDHQKTISYWQQAMNNKPLDVSDAKSKLNSCFLLRIQGYVLRDSRRSKEALTCFESALEIIEKNMKPTSELEIEKIYLLQAIAYDLSVTKNEKKAIESINEAIALAKKLLQEVEVLSIMQASLVFTKSIILAECRKYETAEFFLKESLKLFCNFYVSQFHRDIFKTYYNLVMVLYNQEKYSEIVNSFSPIIDDFEKRISNDGFLSELFIKMKHLISESRLRNNLSPSRLRERDLIRERDLMEYHLTHRLKEKLTPTSCPMEAERKEHGEQQEQLPKIDSIKYRLTHKLKEKLTPTSCPMVAESEEYGKQPG